MRVREFMVCMCASKFSVCIAFMDNVDQQFGVLFVRVRSSVRTCNLLREGAADLSDLSSDNA